MMKKMFTLLALLACFLGANAVVVQDYSVDYTEKGASPITWKADMIEADWITADGDGLHLYNPAVTTNFYDYQLFICDGITLEAEMEYTVKVTAKVSDGAANVRYRFGGWSGFTDGSFDVNSTDYQEYELTIKAPISTCGLMVQFGDYVGTLSFKSITITHEERDNQRPKEWIELLENGDAETPWADPNVRFNDQENNYKICAWGKEKGVNMNDDGGWDPFPATIEDDGTGNHVFVVHGKPADSPANADGADVSAWDNQFWIQSTRQLKAGELLKIHFRYKASEAANTNTQMHHQTPSDYMHYVCIGDVAFTTEWQEFDKEVTWPAGGDDKAWSIAFNLNPSNKNAVDFYFDDLSIQELKLDKGWFVASSSTTNGIEYNYDNAIEFEVFDEGILTATVGTKGKPETWVNEIMISSVRGHDGTFKSSTINPTSTNIVPFNLETEEGGIYDYAPKSNAKIALPAAGVWQILLFPDNQQIAFVQIEGDAVVVKDPVDIVTNATANIVKGQERQPTAAEQPADEEAGIAAGTGQAWDNQFFILANREIKTGENVTLKFKYKSSVEAKTTTQLHGDPGAYIYWNAIGDVNFTTEWQDFEKTWVIPAGDGNAEISFKSIAFNMAEIKEACDYEIKDVQWYVQDDALAAEGKTMENLIDAEGDANFYVKEGAGTAPYVVSGISSVNNDKKVSNNAIYNLAGQRVSKEYKGIVIKNGAKYIAK